MAWEAPIQVTPALVATNSLLTKQFLFVKLDASHDEQVLICAAHTDRPHGVLQNKPDTGEAASVMRLGITKVVAGGTVVCGDEVGTDANGKAVTKHNTATGADLGDYVVGECIHGGAINELITVALYGPYRIGAGGT